MNITFIAPPAAGKGALSSMICEKYGFVHVSIGDLLRNVEDETIKKQLQTGAFVSNEIVAKLLKDRLSKDDCKKGYVLDGFPRNMSQVSIYEDICKGNNIIITLDIPKEVGQKRIAGRRVCPNCGDVYNEFIKDSMPKEPGICDSCHHELITRADDNLEVYENRYNTYINETAPILDYYASCSNIYHIDGSKSLDETFRQIEEIIGGLND